MKKIVLFGYGNPGRKDDGLGPEFISRIEPWAKKQKHADISTDCNFQLNIEDSLTISDKDMVIFIDASEEPIQDFILTEVQPEESEIQFTMHSVTPSFVLDLCRTLYHSTPETYLLHIKGYSFDFEEGLSPRAEKNLAKALRFIKKALISPDILKNFAKQEMKDIKNN